MRKIEKLEEKLRKKFNTLLNDYGRYIKLNGNKVVAIYISGSTNIGIQELGIVPTNQTTVYLPISQVVNTEDIIELKGKKYRVKEIDEYFGVYKKVQLEKLDIESTTSF